MSIKSKIEGVRLALKTGIKATDAALKITREIEKETQNAINMAKEIKEMMSQDEDEEDRQGGE